MDTITAADPPSPDALPTATPDPARPDAPQLRTLLLTDLVDSTMLVERLGDGPAAELFRAHDAIVLRLQEQWRGRLIDRSDGLLLLFERPIDGLGFALDYARGLRDLGIARGIDLKARAGLHVGEVLTWRNSVDAVRVGAKPLEVEGLAKPMAGRLMTMARPGQILLSAIAEPLAHRAASELGERGELLLWKTHGRWRFKGVPQVQEIFEVGEAGIAPLRAPLTSNKAWRDIPLWRRPAALATELTVLLVVAGVGTWFAFKPQPAIAFGERDWVVVGDLRNLTGQPALDETLEQAFRISLEQSRYVNVLSDMKARDTLARMRRPLDTPIDRAIGSEIAVRDGVRAVILPTVSEVGGRVRVSVEVVDPRTQATVHVEMADGKGVASTLGSIDAITASLREEFGESVDRIRQSSRPLPTVTTSNLDALRAYALGQDAYAESRHPAALAMYQRATALDQGFALAWLGQARAHVAMVQASEAIPPLRRAQALRSRLAEREKLYLDAWGSVFDAPGTTRANWQQLAQLYPDFLPGVGNAALWAYMDNSFAEAAALATRNAVPQYELASVAYDTLGRALLGQERSAQALEALRTAVAGGNTGSLRRMAMAQAVLGQHDEALKTLDRSTSRYAGLERVAVLTDVGRAIEAREAATQALSRVPRSDGFDHALFVFLGATVDWNQGRTDSALRAAGEVLADRLKALESPDDFDDVDNAGLALSASLLFARANVKPPSDALRITAALPQLKGVTVVRELEDVVRAERLVANGQPGQAIELLTPQLTGRERFQTRVSLGRAHAAAGDMAGAIRQHEWIKQHAGRAYVELDCGHCLQTLNIGDRAKSVRGTRPAPRT